MRRLFKYWKIMLAIVVISFLTFAVGHTLKSNMVHQKDMAKNAKQMPITAVETVRIKSTETQQALTLTGVLNAYQTLELLSETDGRVTEVHFDVNQNVTLGQVLVRTNDKAKQIQSKMAEINYDKAKRDFERYEALYKNNNLSEFELENARFQMESAEQNVQLNKQVIDFTTISSPMSGNVIQKFVSIGKVLQVGTPIAVITDISQFRLIVNIAPQDLHLVRQGTVVEVAVPSQGLEGIKGVVKSVSVQATEAGSFPVEIIVANNQSKLLRAGMQAEVRFATDEHRKALLIPRVAVAGDQVFVVVDGKALAKKVSIAKEYGTEVEITSGLSEGDLLVIKGQNNLENNQPVQVSSSNQ